MNALGLIRGEVVKARVRAVSAAALLGLLAAALAFPIGNEAWRHDEHRFAADPNVHRLVEAIMEADVAEVRRLLSDRALDLDALDGRGMTPLAHAIVADDRSGGDSLVTLLIEHGADVNRPDAYGHTPLMWSVGPGSERLTALLLRAGADPRRCRPDGTTVLHVAAHSEASATVAGMLLTAGADPSARDREGKTPAAYAHEAGLTELGQRLAAPARQRTLVIR